MHSSLGHESFYEGASATEYSKLSQVGEGQADCVSVPMDLFFNKSLEFNTLTVGRGKHHHHKLTKNL